jgi:hypothetical protein
MPEEIKSPLSTIADPPPWWVNPPPEQVLRFMAAQRLDGVGLHVMIGGDGVPRFLATFPTDPKGAAVMLEARELAAAVLETDTTWPPSTWCTKTDELPADAVDLGGGEIRLPLMLKHSGSFRHDPLRIDGTAGPFEGRTEPIPFARFRILGYEIVIVEFGQGASVTIERPAVNGGASALYAPQRYDLERGEGRRAFELRRLRMFPVIDANNCTTLVGRIESKGEACVSINLIARRVVDPALDASNQGIQS